MYSVTKVSFLRLKVTREVGFFFACCGYYGVIETT